MAATKKKPIAKVKMRIMGGNATPAPPVGSALGQHGVNMMDFINPFNEQTATMKGQMVSTSVVIYEDKSMSFTVKGESAVSLIKKAAKIDKASGVPNKEKVAKLSMAQITEIAEAKMDDLNANDLEAAKKIIAGTARSMGIEVE